MAERNIVSSANRQSVGDDQGRSGESREETRAPFYRRLLRVMKRHSEQLLHAQRRRRATARLQRYPEPPSILLVCVGNICRSPYAAAVLRQRLNGFLGKEYQFRSAGFMGGGQRPPADAIQVASRRNVDLSAHRSQMITAHCVRESELIVVMDQHQANAVRHRFPIGRRQICLLGDLDPEPIVTRGIEDPIEQPPEVFQRAYERIDRCLDQLVRAVTKSATSGQRPAIS